MKVFVTVGTHERGFDALLNALVPWVAKGTDTFVVQSGHSSVGIPGAWQNEWFSREEFARELAGADLVVAHLGCGIAREVQVAGKSCIFVARSKGRGEHIDDHQLELEEVLKERPGLAFALPSEDLEGRAKALSGKVPAPPLHHALLVEAIKHWLCQKTS